MAGARKSTAPDGAPPRTPVVHAIPPAAAELLEPWREAYELCAYCPKMCRFSCPVAEADARETLTPWGKMSAPFLALAAKRAMVSLETAVETAWACTGCGHCTEYCVHGNDVAGALTALRAAGAAAGISHPAATKARAALERKGDLALRSSVSAPGSTPVLFMPGCGEATAAMRAAAKIAERLGGTGIELVGDGVCCGAALWWAGAPAEFDTHAKKFAKAVSRRRTLVVADAGCTWILRELYPKRGIVLRPEVLHASQWIAAFFQERALRAREKLEGRFLYHDPCSLARGLDVVDEPRAVLSAILADGVREFAWNRRDAVCCGGGAMLPRTMPETAGRMAKTRAAEALAAKAAVVTSCPSCREQLSSAGVETHDLLTLVARAL